jgi:hypothetical protein
MRPAANARLVGGLAVAAAVPSALSSVAAADAPYGAVDLLPAPVPAPTLPTALPTSAPCALSHRRRYPHLCHHSPAAVRRRRPPFRAAAGYRRGGRAIVQGVADAVVR